MSLTMSMHDWAATLIVGHGAGGSRGARGCSLQALEVAASEEHSDRGLDADDLFVGARQLSTLLARLRDLLQHTLRRQTEPHMHRLTGSSRLPCETAPEGGNEVPLHDRRSDAQCTACDDDSRLTGWNREWASESIACSCSLRQCHRVAPTVPCTTGAGPIRSNIAGRYT